MKALILSLITTLSMSAYAQGSSDEPNFVLRPEFQIESIKIPSEGNLKIMWWNIGCSSTRGLKNLSSTEKLRLDPINQWENLKQTIESKSFSPDVLILGEYCPGAFDQRTYNLIESLYPHVFKLIKSNPLYKARNGMRIFSKFKIIDPQVEVLSGESFLKNPAMQSCSSKVKKRSPKLFQEKFWNRPMVGFGISKGSKDYNIIATHLSNPWGVLKSCAGSLNTYGEVVKGVQNPNYEQAKEIVESLLGNNSMVVIGDFNAPKKILFGRSNSYYILSQGFGESVIKSQEATFDDPRRSFGNFSLDHAFVSSDLNVKYGEVLPFAGADHLPIYIVVD